MQEEIRNVQVFLHEDVADCIVWSGDASGEYTARSGYGWLRERACAAMGGPLQRSWAWIWKLHAPFKVCFLIWLLARNALPTNALRFHRNMAPSPVCGRCHLYPERPIHCMRDCVHAQRVWTSLGLSVPATPGCSSRVDLEFERIVPEGPSRANHRPVREVAWTPPGENEVAVNCDGSKGEAQHNSGYGGCLRDNHGTWLGGFMGFGHDASVLAMELLAVFKGLQLAWDGGFRRVVCFTDSLLAVSLILRPPSEFHENAAIIRAIGDLLNRSWEVHLQHTLREGNFCADFLAKAGARQQSEYLPVMTLLLDPPSFETVTLLLALARKLDHMVDIHLRC
ncbi:uncharacterized protein LOC130736871 [Lotus japonicus]|uniref:uncharacterized protein LOC130736871 n=1 Tax=Lotus japonicus TaxID=34305 RepID=UPI002590C69C|nr:uncharacterized protein LOC130736871 [Lotus japonicus]